MGIPSLCSWPPSALLSGLQRVPPVLQMVNQSSYLLQHREALEAALCVALEDTLRAKPENPIGYCAMRLAAQALSDDNTASDGPLRLQELEQQLAVATSRAEKAEAVVAGQSLGDKRLSVSACAPARSMPNSMTQLKSSHQ